MISVNEAISIGDYFGGIGKPTGLFDPMRRKIADEELDITHATVKGIGKAIRNTKDVATFWKSPEMKERFHRDAQDVALDAKHFGKKGYRAIERAFEDDPIKMTAALAVAAGMGLLGYKGLKALKDRLAKKPKE